MSTIVILEFAKLIAPSWDLEHRKNRQSINELHSIGNSTYYVQVQGTGAHIVIRLDNYAVVYNGFNSTMTPWSVYKDNISSGEDDWIYQLS